MTTERASVSRDRVLIRIPRRGRFQDGQSFSDSGTGIDGGTPMACFRIGTNGAIWGRAMCGG